MTKPYGYHEQKDALLKRLNRSEGQIRGIARQVAADTYCIDILTQIAAAQAALDKVALELVRSHARHCLETATTATERDRLTDELVRAIGRLR